MENKSETINQLKNRCDQLERQNADLKEQNDWLKEQFRLKQKKQFGSSSEATPPDQLQFFNEAEKESDSNSKEPELEEITYKRRKSKGHREDQLDGLPEETIEHRLSPEEQVCSCCGDELHEMSTEERKELKIIPAKASVVKHVRYVYACRRCDKEGTENSIITASMPNPVLPGSVASSSAVAHIMNQKYVDALPLYRQEQQLSRLGIKLSRQTMANWMIECSNRWLTPLYNRLHELLVEKDILHADESNLQVLREDGRSAKNKSFLWLYRTGREDEPIILYDYRTTRASKHPRKFLADFEGFLQVDGYSGYNDLSDISLVGCLAHARRKFDEALKALPKDQQNAQVSAKKGLEFCNQLFAIEHDLRDKTPEERHKIRHERSLPVLEEFYAWLKEQKPKVLPKSAFGKAINYCLNQWPKLVKFLEDGRLELDNNRAERSIKPFVVGRKNWLFANTPKGAKASATIYSIVETAKENGLKPFEYLKFLFENLPNIDLQDQEAIDELLPWSDAIPSECKIQK
ncbi:IS66 family transposase [Natranaerofaba carboxydovora]|uniref:IS66 family transposase n=1 Tax=Natranaerofaba carboxydovora TaxID=2742683 RepID=UPI001F137EDF|nr:IS66 family transposase [Natranaerofaba carboxydovora]UMZ72528.1 Transposase IS66 family protein [Natranaerofaba carboxydovora]UMZ73036.1 Transposase IS66 family protein [Natranaerofaba carboxydovora]UMZ73107.1 Transposase IS66 family protein [Natranaerofaba carboxydovora]UMZ73732.1 Transposase IS66 family protein [Natranaerofaba carboxydovora]UMZ74391.1 Transposase IS66 family protein [Natranaerofaba carboxydovora]